MSFRPILLAAIWAIRRCSRRHTFYYQGNYPRLQGIKARYDPRDVFRHALAVRAR